MTDTAPNAPAAAAGAPGGLPAPSRHEQAYDKLVTGHLTLKLVATQLDAQIATLRAQLAVAEGHRRRTAELLAKAEARLAEHHPATHAVVTAELVLEPQDEPPRSARRSR